MKDFFRRGKFWQPENYIICDPSGAPYLPPELALKLFCGVRRMKAPPPEGVWPEPLTPRQEEILALLGEGRTDAEIAALLHLSEGTVRFHVHKLLQRLGLETRAQAAAYAHTRRRAGE